EQQWTRAIIGADRVMSVRQQRAEDRLRNVVATRGELIQDEVFLRDLRLVLVGLLFDVVECARHERMVDDGAPVELWLGLDAARRRFDRGSRRGRGSHVGPKYRAVSR